MKTVALVLSAVIVAASVEAQPRDRPLAPSAIRASLDTLPGVHGSTAWNGRGWQRVRQLPPDTPVVVFVGLRERREGLMGGADESSLILVDVRGQQPSVAKAMKSVAADHSEFLPLAWTAGGFDHQGIFVRLDGVFVGPVRVAPLEAILQRIPRDQVAEVRVGPLERGSVARGIAGMAAGVGLALWASTYLMEKDCGGGCGDEEALVGLVLVGAPSALGVIGYNSRRHVSEQTVYEASAVR